MGFWKSVSADIRNVLELDPAARSKIEVVLTYPGLHALWAHRIAHGLWTRKVKLMAKLIAQTSRWLTGIEIHRGPGRGSGDRDHAA